MKILAVGDLHWKSDLGYADFFADRREKEKETILDFIVHQAKDHDMVVFMGDQLNARNNTSKVLKEFVAFLERFGNKELWILAGNHELQGDGSSALDFLKELKGKGNWNIVSGDITVAGKKTEAHEGLVFCPYFYKSMLGVETNQEGWEKISSYLPLEGGILFHHHAVTGSALYGQSVNLFDEILFPKKEVESRFKLVVGGHVHMPQVNKKTVVTGSIFNDEIGETYKCLWSIDWDGKEAKAKAVKLPGRKLALMENPIVAHIRDMAKLENLGAYSLVKAVFTQKYAPEDLEAAKEALRAFEAHIILEQYPAERKKINFEEGMLEFTIEQLLDVYAKEKSIAPEKLRQAWELVRS